MSVAGRQETPDSQALQAIFDALLARRKAEARRQYAEAVAILADAQQAVAQKLAGQPDSQAHELRTFVA